MLMHLLVPKSAQNNSIKGEFEGSIYFALEDAPEIFLQGALKIVQNGVKKINFTL